MGLISKNYDGAQEARYLHSLLNLLDFSLAIAVFVSPSKVGFLCVLRVLRLLTYLKNLDRFEYLREVCDLLQSSSFTTMSILGVMIVCVLFMAMLLNSLAVGVVKLRGQSTDFDLARCRFLNWEGKYKIDETQIYLCSQTDPGLQCKDDSLCISKHSSTIENRGSPGFD